MGEIEATLEETIETQAKALASEARVAMLRALQQGELSAGKLAEAAGISIGAASQQLAKLRHAGFVTSRRSAQWVYYRLREGAGSELLRFLEEIPR